VLRHGSDHPFKILEKQPENNLALAQGAMRSLGVVAEEPDQALRPSGTGVSPVRFKSCPGWHPPETHGRDARAANFGRHSGKKG